MSLNISRLPAAQRIYDSASPDDIDSEFDEWESTIRPQLTDEEIERWITEFARSGYFEDELGQMKNMIGTVEHAVALQWVGDKARVGGIIGAPFWRWAKATANLQWLGK